MKQFRFFTMLMLCVAAMGFTMTSCLSDTDDDSNKVKPLTPADKAAMIAEMAGEYNGYIYFVNDSSRMDSILVHSAVTASDSLFTIYDFPYKALTPGIADETLRDIITNAGEGIFKDVLQFYANTSKDKGFYTFMALPLTADQLERTFNYDGKEHTIKLKYAAQIANYNIYGASSIYYPCGEFYKNEMIVYILFNTIEVDGDVRTLNRVLYYYGKK